MSSTNSHVAPNQILSTSNCFILRSLHRKVQNRNKIYSEVFRSSLSLMSLFGSAAKWQLLPSCVRHDVTSYQLSWSHLSVESRRVASHNHLRQSSCDRCCLSVCLSVRWITQNVIARIGRNYVESWYILGHWRSGPALFILDPHLSLLQNIVFTF